jgi:hypothetical protein
MDGDEKDSPTLRAEALRDPPTVTFDDVGAVVLFDEVPQWRIAWSPVRKIEVYIHTVPDLEYSEAFWRLAGDGVTFDAPIDLIAGGEEYLQAFPGFDHAAYEQAKEAEARGDASTFLCWVAS